MMNNLNTLVTLLGDENVDKIKKTITDEIIENIREAVREEYLLLPSDIEEEFKSICDEECAKILKTYRKEIRAALKEKFEDWINELGGDKE